MKGILFIATLAISTFLISWNTFGNENDPNVNQNTSKEYSDSDHMSKPGLIHTVYFWTKEGTSKEDLAAFEKGLVTLGTCPTIQAYYWGPPAPTEDRGVIDNSYTYAINVHFATLEDEAAYQIEPIHLKFIEDHNAIWEKVVVYDNIVK